MAVRCWRPATTSLRVVSRTVSRGLFRARDADRDQSYFLFATTRDQLDFLRFPLGDMTKAQTRELARRFGLSVADKHDSQDICFVPSGRYGDVIERLKPGAAQPGDIVDADGRVLGSHPGIIHFTVGQRRGLGIAAGHPLYVVRLDAASRRVVVGPREALRTSRIKLREVNWLGDGAIDQALCAGWHEVFIKVRSTRSPQAAWLSRGAKGIEVDLVDSEEGVSPGQACVFYDAAGSQARVLAAASFAAPLLQRACPRGRAGARAASVCQAEVQAVLGGMADEIDIATVAKAYARWAPFYDLVFGAVFSSGRKASIAAAERIGGRILDIGIGTGISLIDYPPAVRVVGVDYSEPMLRKAHERAVSTSLPTSRRWP